MTDRTSIAALITAVSLTGCLSTRSPLVSADAGSARVSVSAPRVVHGDLDIANRDSLHAFEDLEIVTGTLTIVGNTRLRDLDGLGRLRAVGNLVVTENVNLENIEGLSGLEHARGVVLKGNPRLEDLRGLDSLRRVHRLVVEENGIFATRGLDGLVEVGELVIVRNRRLLSLRGLSQLTSAVDVTIVENPRLSAQGGLLPKLDHVRGKFELRRNTGLSASDVCFLATRVKERPLASR